MIRHTVVFRIKHPADGLDVRSDEGGEVGPYTTPNKFTGKIGYVTIELDAK